MSEKYLKGILEICRRHFHVYVLFFSFLLLYTCTAVYSNFKTPEPQWQQAKIISLNGIDYKQVQVPLGKFGGTLNLSIVGSGPKTFNIWASTDAGSSTLSSLMFDSLFTDDPDTGEMVPHLAKSYEIKDSGKTIIVKLRKGVKWSDGVPITSDDVVFTWNNIVFSGLEGGGFNSLCLIDGKYPTVKKIDDYTVEFMTHITFAPFLRQLSYPPAPKHIFEPLIINHKKDTKKIFLAFWGADTKPENFVTSGPFKLSRYVQGERIEFIRNPDYFVTNTENKRLPYLDKIVYSIVQDPSLELFKFLAGEIDTVSIPGEDVALIKSLEEKTKKFKVVNLGPNSGTGYLVFNLHKPENGICKGSCNWFNNLYFRKAISHAIDRAGIVDNVLAGVGKPLFTPESLPSIYLNKKIANGYPQDLNFSKELLKKGGFSWNKDKELIDENGNKIEFTILTVADSRQSTAVILQDDLKKLGIKANLRPIDFNTLVGKSDTGDWEAIILGFTGGFFEPNEGANVWKLNGRLHMFDQKPHKPRDWEVEIDHIFNEATRYIDFQSRKNLYDRFQEIVYDELPFIYLVSSLRIFAIQNNLGNVRPTIYGGTIYNLESIYKR
ncbi:MAG: ABC transporter substrate-binding protein [Candidatus Melainabacteria bacterium]|nr:ABC transporter substrate-binding protein [Candidatus Melainabacteria bacterium]